MRNKFAFIVIAIALSGCSFGYKSTWDCPKEKGIGCSSVEYADRVAKDQIILNTKQIAKDVLINEDLLGMESLTEVEIR